jgi:hypothetical protein
VRSIRFIIILLIVSFTASFFIYKSSYIISLFSNDPLFLRLINKSKPVKSKAISLDIVVTTDKWKTYENDEYHYSIKYRPEFQVREFENKSWVSIDNVKEDILPGEKDWFAIIIKIKPNDSSLSPRKYLELYARTDPNCRSRILDSFTEYKNNKIDGIKGNVDPCSNFPNMSVIFTDNDQAFVIELGADASFNPPYTETKIKLFDQILSTFRFTD